jgi:lipopolysaccharide transport system permease protein
MACELIQGRELMWRLFLRDISARYRQSVFGYVWAVLPAIVTVATFTYLKGSGTLPIGETNIPYPAYVLLGMSVWQLFATGLTRTTQSLVQASAIITKINFARETLVLAAFGESIFNFLIRIVLIGAVFAWYRVVPAWTVIFVPFVLIPLALMTVGFGFILSIANGVFRDIGSSLTLVMTFAMFLTPVVYPPPTQWPKVLINYLNPVSPFIIATRDLITKGTLSQPDGLLWVSVISLLVFLVGWRIFHLAMSRIVERI